MEKIIYDRAGKIFKTKEKNKENLDLLSALQAKFPDAFGIYINSDGEIIIEQDAPFTQKQKNDLKAVSDGI